MPELKKPKDLEYRENNKGRRKKPSVLWAYGAKSKISMSFDKIKGKQVTCLSCDRLFSGRVNIRICPHCKKREEYGHGATYANMVTRQVC